MKKCPKCNIDMIIIQDDTPHPYSWGGFRLYGCQNCHQVYYQHLDREGQESKDLTNEELTRMQGKKIEKKKPLTASEKKKIKKESARMKKVMKNFDKKWIGKPYYDPMHHHDSHLIN